MSDFQPHKQLVQRYYQALDQAELPDLSSVMQEFCAPDMHWRGFHPFNEMRSAEEVAERFWRPLKASLSRMQRRLDVLMAGQNMYADPGGEWVASMGHLTGLFDHSWLGIPPTGKLICLRYSAFHRIEDGRISETAMYFDIPHFMVQAGLNPFGLQTAAELVQPGPQTHDGLLFDPQPPEEAQRTLDAINAMVADLGRWDCDLPLEDELARTWNDDMLWWGPTGIGATYTIERYSKQHAGPFRAAFTERSPTSHICRMAEGHYGGFFGWPNFTARQTGSFMGRPATGERGEFRVIDIYRRAGDKLAENWIFIDLLHYWKQQGDDILGRIAELGPGQ